MLMNDRITISVGELGRYEYNPETMQYEKDIEKHYPIIANVKPVSRDIAIRDYGIKSKEVLTVITYDNVDNFTELRYRGKSYTQLTKPQTYKNRTTFRVVEM